MISKESIRRTLVSYWSREDDCYVAESPLFPRTAGIGETQAKAVAHFNEMLDDIYDDLGAGNVAGYSKVGRPAKGGVDFHVQIRPGTKSGIASLAKNLDISQGEVIDFIFYFHHKAGGRPIVSEDARQYFDKKFEKLMQVIAPSETVHKYPDQKQGRDRPAKRK